MTYENLVKEAKKAVKSVDVKIIKEHLAIELDVEGAGEGAFYVEFNSDKVEVEPYEYYDHDLRIRADGATVIGLLKGEVDPELAILDGKINVEGNLKKLATMKKYLAPAAESPKKSAAKKSSTKKPATARKSSTAKKTAKKATK